MNVVASAPGKIVVSGEYAVLAGAPALVLAVERRVRVSLRPGAADWSFESYGFTGSSRHRLADLLAGPRVSSTDPAALGQQVLQAIAAAGHPLQDAPADLDVGIDSRAGYEHGRKVGLGSSAAVAVALAAALLARVGAPTTAALPVAHAAHGRAQGGRGSGLDVAAAYHGGLIRFSAAAVGADLPANGRTPNEAAAIRGQARHHRPFSVERLHWPHGLHWLPVWTHASADTPDSLARFEAWRARGAPPALTGLVEAARAVAGAIGAADAFMRELRRYTERLAEFDAAAGLGIVTPAHDRLRAVAGAAVVYKPCGAGGGDLGLACADDPAALEAFGVAAADAGYTPLRMEIARHGVDVSITR